MNEREYTDSYNPDDIVEVQFFKIEDLKKNYVLYVQDKRVFASVNLQELKDYLLKVLKAGIFELKDIRIIKTTKSEISAEIVLGEE
ncbi:hypothetical protein D1872_81510 [compost metagenome]